MLLSNGFRGKNPFLHQQSNVTGCYITDKRVIPQWFKSAGQQNISDSRDAYLGNLYSPAMSKTIFKCNKKKNQINRFFMYKKVKKWLSFAVQGPIKTIIIIPSCGVFFLNLSFNSRPFFVGNKRAFATVTWTTSDKIEQTKP